MSEFVDHALLQLHDPTALAGLITGGGPAPYPRLSRVLSTVFASDTATVDHVEAVSVDSVQPMVLIRSRTSIRGTFLTSQPSHALSDLRADLTADDGPWAQLMATLTCQVSVALDPGGIESVMLSSIENITSLDDFASRFRYLDLDAFLTAHKISTVEQLRDAAQYLLAEIKINKPPAFDPQDSANQHRVQVPLALTVLDQVDLVAGLTRARLLLAAGADQPPAASSDVLGPAQAAFAVAVVFPAQAQPPPDVEAIDALYAKAGVLPLFADPP